jgi:hypothetical protein
MNRMKQMISAIGIALFLFTVAAEKAAALPLTETIYMIPEYSVEILLKDEVYQTDRWSRKDRIGVGFGATDAFSLWLQMDILSQSAFNATKATIGDLFLKGKFYIGDYARNEVHIGFLMELRFPLAPNAYVNDEWRNLALGKYELKLGPFFRFDILDVFFIHLNMFYTFREANYENFWGGLYLNITKQETWEKVFGLNPKAKNTFLNVDRIKNDYISFSMAWNTNYFYPVVPYVEFYGSFRVSGDYIETGYVPIEACKYNAFLMSVGFRYFIMEAVYIGIYTVQNPLQASQKDYIQGIYGIELSVQI